MSARLAAVLVAIAGQAFAETGKAGVEWVVIPGGTFTMGSSETDWKAPDVSKNIRPAHKVTIKTFLLAKTVVTNRQYQKCVEAGACTQPVYESCKWLDPGLSWSCPTCRPEQLTPAERQEIADVKRRGYERRKDIVTDADKPAVCVDWRQAAIFSAWVGGRLPSEAEWEYAARSAGKNQKYPWGNAEMTCRNAVTQFTSGYTRPEKRCSFDRPAPVCSTPAGNTEQGLCDMVGNVYQWVQDYYHDTYANAPADGSAWESSGSKRVLRGMGWFVDVFDVRLPPTSLSRLNVAMIPSSTERDVSFGFRPAMSVVERGRTGPARPAAPAAPAAAPAADSAPAPAIGEKPVQLLR